MKLTQIVEKATDKSNFQSLNGYIDFCRTYLDYVREGGLQAVIVSQNENQYQFYQYSESGNFQITRPINSRLMLDSVRFEKSVQDFQSALSNARHTQEDGKSDAETLNQTVYTMQQSIGAALDALPAGRSNTARKLNGDLY